MAWLLDYFYQFGFHFEAFLSGLNPVV